MDRDQDERVRVDVGRSPILGTAMRFVGSEPVPVDHGIGGSASAAPGAHPAGRVTRSPHAC